jgi:hypothetical protein
MAETRPTRVIQDHANNRRWQPQYYDTSIERWFDMGDPRDTREEAEAARVAATTPDYSDLIEGIAQQYNERILAMLEAMRDKLAEVGYTSAEPQQMWDDNFRWHFTTHNAEGVIGSGSADFMVEIDEQRDYDGDDSPAGLNWSLNIVAYGGLILGGLAPFNFTEQVWVDATDHLAVSTRFGLLHDGIHDTAMEELAELAEKARAEDD